MKRILLGVGLSAVLLVGLLVTFVVGGGVNRTEACTPVGADVAGAANATYTDGPAGLDGRQVGYAVEVYTEAARRELPEQAVLVAFATIWQESSWRMYANDGTGPGLKPEQAGVAGSLDYPHDAVGRDHGSVGLFQQQWPWWGSFAELMDPTASAGLFFGRLVLVEGWEALPVTVAAQRVQRSAYPAAYARWEQPARELLTYVTALNPDVQLAVGPAGTGPGFGGGSGSLGCVENVSASFGACPATGLPVEDGLTPDALLVLRCVDQTFGRHDYHGIGSRGNASDHPSGRAVDVMVADYTTAAAIAHGDRVAQWIVEHAAALGVTYVIWRDRIWSETRAEQGWRSYSHPAGRSDDSAAHRDHVHVSVHGNRGVGLVAAGGIAWPVDTNLAGVRVSDNYGKAGSAWSSGTHTGTDFPAPLGTPVRAVHAGVVRVETDQGWSGPWLVVVETGEDSITTWYAHMSSISVATGDVVQAGQPIGTVGSEGNSTGPHLHLEVRPNGPDGPTTDPIPWLRGVRATAGEQTS